MKFSKLSSYLSRLEKTSSRLEITGILSDVFRSADSNEIDKIVYLLMGQLAPKYEGVVFNIAERMMHEAIAKAFGKDVSEVRKLYKEKGDLGEVSQLLSGNKNSNLSVESVFNELKSAAVDEGEGSQERKVTRISKLLRDLDSLSARFVARIPVGKLRLGFSDKTILDALSWMENGDKSAKSELEKVYFVTPDVGLLAKAVKKHGVKKASEKSKPQVGTPVLPALAQRLKSPSEMVEKMGEVAVEPKFDGLRIQIHLKKGKSGLVRAFTRNMNETSWMFPELLEIGESVHADEIILDTEAIGVDPKRRSLANFQTTMTRRRKHEIEKVASKVSIKFFVFDCLFKDGRALINLPYTQRRKILEKSLNTGKNIELVDYVITKDPKVIEKEMQRELSDGLEGIIVKRTNSKYVAGRTGWRWVKMKEEEAAVAKLADTIDCVVMGYYAGRGKRSQFGLGGFLVGVSKSDKFLTLTKIGTGLTDDQFRELKKRLSEFETEEKPKEYGEVEKNLVPDVWVNPSLVVEIAADEITKSPTHSSGYALRFPRLVKFRDDKSANQATTISEIRKIYRLQKSTS